MKESDPYRFNPQWGFCSFKESKSCIAASRSWCFNPQWGFCSFKAISRTHWQQTIHCFNPQWGFCSFKAQQNGRPGPKPRPVSILSEDSVRLKLIEAEYNPRRTTRFNPQWGFCSFKDPCRWAWTSCHEVSILSEDSVRLKGVQFRPFGQVWIGFNPQWGFCSFKDKLTLDDCAVILVFQSSVRILFV